MSVKNIITYPILMMALIYANQTMAGDGAGEASWYGGRFHGQVMADGSKFNKHAMTTASNIHRMGTMLKVTNLANSKCVVVKVTDRGGFSKYGRHLDLSQGAFDAIADLDSGVIRVKYEVIK